jgi:hypothetical protein
VLVAVHVSFLSLSLSLSLSESAIMRRGMSGEDQDNRLVGLGTTTSMFDLFRFGIVSPSACLVFAALVDLLSLSLSKDSTILLISGEDQDKELRLRPVGLAAAAPSTGGFDLFRFVVC